MRRVSRPLLGFLLLVTPALAQDADRIELKGVVGTPGFLDSPTNHLEWVGEAYDVADEVVLPISLSIDADSSSSGINRVRRGDPLIARRSRSGVYIPGSGRAALFAMSLSARSSFCHHTSGLLLGRLVRVSPQHTSARRAPRPGEEMPRKTV